MRPAPRGFTLIEVLVALAVVGIALVSLVKATGHTADNALALEQRFHARWAAQNELALARALLTWPDAGEETQTVSMSRQSFTLKRVVTATPNPNFRKLEIEVRSADSDTVLARLNTLLKRPGL